MRHKHARLIVVVAILAWLLSACGGGGSAPTSTSQENGSTDANAQPTSLPPSQAQLSPRTLGENIGAVYVEALAEVTLLIEEEPAVDEARLAVEALKEKYVQQLVELGRQREALSAQDRATVDSAISLRLNAIGREPWYQTYNQVLQSYFNEDYEFYQLVSSFNIIGQYANFDLLKQQEPDEAERLGIK